MSDDKIYKKLTSKAQKLCLLLITPHKSGDILILRAKVQFSIICGPWKHV